MPLMMYCQSELTPIRFKPLFRMPMISAPISVPPSLPEPPDMEVPPMTTAAMASISAALPEVQVPEYRREAMVTPARPASVPLMAKTVNLTFAVLMPENFAAVLLPPTA